MAVPLLSCLLCAWLVAPRAPSPARTARAVVTAVVSAPDRLFGDLPLPAVLSDALLESGFKAPTPIQSVAAMPIYRGDHTLVHSETGSGKTLAYLLPLLSRLHPTRPSQLLIIVPSRELALQTAAVIERFWPHHGTRRAHLAIGGEDPAQQADLISRVACPVLVATPKVLLKLVRHLAGTDRLHSRRALSMSGAALTKLAAGLQAVALDEADALLLTREIAIAGPPRRKSYRELSGGSGDVKAPERFSQPTARALQAIIKARGIATSPRGPIVARGGGGRGGSGRGGRGGKKAKGAKNLQLVACSATASYRLREELGRLLEIDTTDKMQLVSPSSSEKRSAGKRGVGGVGVPTSISHSWVPCETPLEKPAALASVLRATQPSAVLMFLPDDAPLRSTVADLRGHGVEAVALHEAMGLHEGTARASSYDTLSEETAAVSTGTPSRTTTTPTADSAAADATDVAVPTDAPPRDGRVLPRVLVSTFGSARGLDLPNVDCVVLFSLPASADAYLHVAGRTGRQSRRGRVLAFLTEEERSQVGTLTRQLGISMKPDAELAMALAEGRQ